MEQIKCEARQFISITVEEYKALIWELAQQEQRLEVFRLKEEVAELEEKLDKKRSESIGYWSKAHDLEEELEALKKSIAENETTEED